jgi:murein endopeptidase
MMYPTLFQRVARKVDKTVAAFLFIDQWIIMTAQAADYDSLRWQALRPLIPEKDRYWGDPFVMQKGERFFVFVEEKIYAAGRAHIACLTLDMDGRLLTHQVVLERDYHLSYPFLFEHGGQLYMIPESAAHRTVEAYRCTHFPDQWEFHQTLMKDVYATDATLLDHQGRSWLFANIKEPGGSSLNALHLFWAASPFAEVWTPHPRNPIVRDIRSARPAGRILVRDGQLIRPSQDSAIRYGYALKFNWITKLTEDDYKEETVAVFAPSGGRIRATHTFNQAGGLAVIDAVLRRPK